MVDNKKGEDYTDLCRRATNYFKVKSVEIAKDGGTVIIDIGLWTKAQREELREFYKKENVNFEIHYVKVDDETWKKNIEERNKRIDAGNRGYDFYVGDGLLEKIKNRWEEPESNEADIVHKVKR